MNLVEACETILKNNMCLTADENLLLIKDHTKQKIADAFETAGNKLCKNVLVIKIPLLEFNGMEPPEEAAKSMLNADVIVVTTSRSLSWTNARKKATSNGARLASMARITEDILIRTAQTDYQIVKNRVNMIADIIDNSSNVKIISDLGTDIAFSIDGRKAHGRKGGIYDAPGKWGNIPCGEAFTAPVEETTNGVYVVDGSQAGVGRLDIPICIIVKRGFAVDIVGGNKATEFKKMLLKVNDKNAFAIGEFGIGANDQAILSGVILEDEKVYGTCHIALGRNDLFGGNIKTNIHVDGVIIKPTIYFDDKLFMRNGNIVNHKIN